MICTIWWFLITLLFCRIETSEQNSKTSSKRAYCGNKLTAILGEFCLVYFSPPEQRVKRQIVSECCHNKCSLDFLLENYCHTVDTAALENYKSAGDNEESNNPAVSQASNPKLSRRYRLKSNLEKENVPSDRPRERKNRGKRNCTCKKHKKRKKSRRNDRQLREILSRTTRPNLEPKLGHVEEGPIPFYFITQQRI